MELAAYVVPEPTRAGVVRRLLRLEREQQLSPEQCFELPNGMVIAHANRGETEFLYDEVFVKRDYLQHGVVVPEDACVFDVGANIGMFSLLVGSIAPSARVFAFEPMPAVFALLQANAELYGLRATLFDCGLAAEAGTASFTYFPHNSILSGTFANPEDETAAIRAMLAADLDGNGTSPDLIDDLLRERTASEPVVRPMRTLSDVIDEHGVERIDLLKIDVETSESDVLAGIEAADWPKIQQLVVEVHERSERLDRIVNLLRGHGFLVAAEEGNPGSGLAIVHAHRDKLASADSPADPGWQSPSRLRTDLRTLLKAKLPEYMVPASITLLEKLPLSPNGKLDRKALPPPDEARSLEEYTAARTPVEEAVVEIWSELLGAERVGIRDSFFDLGGHSILLAQTAARIRDRFHVDVSLRTMFQGPTIRLPPPAWKSSSVSREERAACGRRRGPDPTAPASVFTPFPLSPSQQGLWLLDRRQPESPAYNVALAFRLLGELDIAGLRWALASLVDRHEILRTVYVVDGDEAVSVLKNDWELELPVIDLGYIGAEQRETEIDRQLDENARHRSTSVPICSASHAHSRCGRRAHLVLQTHHIAFDGWSEAIFLRELGDLYETSQTGQPSPLPEPALQYGDFAVWQREQLSGERLASELAWWRERLAGAPTLVELLSDRPRTFGTARGATHRFAFPARWQTQYVLAVGARTSLRSYSSSRHSRRCSIGTRARTTS